MCGTCPVPSWCRGDVHAAIRTFLESHAAGQVPTGAIACGCLEKCRSCPEGETLSPRLVEKGILTKAEFSEELPCGCSGQAHFVTTLSVPLVPLGHRRVIQKA